MIGAIDSVAGGLWLTGERISSVVLIGAPAKCYDGFSLSVLDTFFGTYGRNFCSI